MGSLLSRTLEPEHLVYRIAAGLHAQRPIGLHRGVIGVFDVKPKTDHVRIGLCLVADMLKESAKDAAATIGLGNIDALEPPEPAVAPVAPFPGDRGLTDDAAEVHRSRRPSNVADRDRPGPARLLSREWPGSRTLPSVSSARRRLNSTIVGRSASAASRISTVGGGSLKGGRSGGCGRDGSPLEGPEALLRSVRPGLRGRSWRGLHRAGVELLFGDDGDRRGLAALPTLADVREVLGDRVRVCSRGTGEKMRSLGLKTRPENNRDHRKSNCLNRNAKPPRPGATRRRRRTDRRQEWAAGARTGRSPAAPHRHRNEEKQDFALGVKQGVEHHRAMTAPDAPTIWRDRVLVRRGGDQDPCQCAEDRRADR